jgi:hypothetical protein
MDIFSVPLCLREIKKSGKFALTKARRHKGEGNLKAYPLFRWVREGSWSV